MMRFTATIIAICLSVLVSPWLLLPVACLHALAWFAWELILIGLCVDVYFGAASGLPYYTLAAIVLVSAAEWVKPQLLFYARD